MERAEREDKPILLSIGYSACHWCHVMERESFENESIARAMNQAFVCIKVDREERPDLDDVYMAATIAISGSGGWPMTVFCTPEQVPFFAGTYFPPEDRHGRPGFLTLLTRIAQLWEQDRDKLFRQAGEVRDHLMKGSNLSPPQTVSAASWELATGQLARAFDETWGGFGPAPKFPPSQALHHLLRQYHRTGNADLLEMVTKTLDAMHQGGLYDHIGGGFARYSVDDRWLVPHFEKMLYDNAQLPRVYLEAYCVTRQEAYRSVVVETLDYIIRDMQDESGGYYSATDADSEGTEGKFYVFTPKQVRKLLEPEETRAFCAYYDVTEAGNWEGVSIPNTPRSLDEVARELRLGKDELTQLLASSKAKVFEGRRRRVAPQTDDKILVGWNGLMLATMAEAGRVLGEARYVDSARRAAGFLVQTLLRPDGRLFRTARSGRAHLNGVLEDYAYLADGLIDLYEASGERSWLKHARGLADVLLEEFLDTATGTFFQTAHSHEPLIVRRREGNDGALPNAGAIAARALVRLGHHYDEPRLHTIATASIRAYGNAIERQPRAFLTTLNVAEWLLTGPTQLFFSGPFEATRALRDAAAQVFLPQRVVAYSDEPSTAAPERAGAAVGVRSPWSGESVASKPTPWAENLPTDGTPCLYICRDYSCRRPVLRAEDVQNELTDEALQARKQRARTLALPRVPGWATPEGTHRYFERQLLDPSATRRLGRQQPVLISRVGFGTHRVHESIPSHQEALLLALRQGCNVIDTAPVYGDGASERAVGNALSELQRTGEVRRDEVVLVTKLGLAVPNSSASEDTSAVKAEAVADAMPRIDPAYLERQLDGSLDRLNVDCIDVCLLHNPEQWFDEPNSDHGFAQLRIGLQWLESQARLGRVQRYGVASNALGQVNSPFSLEQLVEAAAAVGAERFEVVELPLNLVELQVRESGLLSTAERLGLAVLTTRPLNALAGSHLVRLWDAPEIPDAPELDVSRQAVAALEHEFRAQLGAVLRAVPDIELASDRLFTWSERIGSSELISREMWNEFERGVLGKELPYVIAALNQAMAGKHIGQLWESWRERYVHALEQLVLAAQSCASRATNQRNARLRDALLATAPEGMDRPTLSQLAVHRIGSEPGVTAVLVGMRQPKYASEVTATLRFPEWEALEAPPSFETPTTSTP